MCCPELDKENPIFNKASSSIAVSKLSMTQIKRCSRNAAAYIVCDRKGKGTHGLMVVKKLLADKEDCMESTGKRI